MMTLADKTNRRFCTTGASRAGFTLTELAIVLGVIGLLLAGIWAAIGNVQENRKVQQATTQQATIISNFRSLYNKGRRVTDADGTELTSLAIANAYLPSDMATSASTFGISPWGGPVKIYASKTYNAIEIAYSKLNRKGCNRLGNGVVTGNAGAIAMLIASTPSTTGTRIFAPIGTDTPYSVDEVAAICSNSDTNYIVAYYSMGN